MSHWRKLILAFVFFWRVLEASLAENKSGLKRKRGDPWVRFVDPVNPYERQRLDGCPVGLKNVGNTCWFSAVIQVCISICYYRHVDNLETHQCHHFGAFLKNSILWCILEDSSVHAFLLLANFLLNKRHTLFQNTYDFYLKCEVWIVLFLWQFEISKI